jgi:CTP synthase
MYGTQQVSERHRHRYEVSNAFRDGFIEHGLTLSGLSPDGSLVEIVELQTHPWYLGCQFHPELKSRPTRPHPLFAGFIAAAAQHALQQSPTAGAQAHAGSEARS